MEDVLKMDIFFAVTTAAVIILTVLVSILLLYAIRLMRTLNRISLTVAQEAQAIRADLIEARASAKRKGAKAVAFIEMIGATVLRMLSSKKRTARTRKADS